MASSQDIEERLRAALTDRYRIERELGSGGMATVYLAEDLKHKRLVAVKVLDPDLAEALGPDRFLREIEVAANLTHPHILPVHDSGEADGLLFYVMPYVEGESLRSRLDREKQLPVDDAVQITREIASALAYAHDRGVIHRDVKPTNILLESGHAVLADFGVAQAVAETDESRLTGTGVSLGTPTYMSPEQAAGEKSLDGRSDQYALGCVAYEMLVGEPPHTGSTAQAVVAKVLSTDPQPTSEVRRSVPGNVAAAVHKALEKVPADRFAATDAFAQALADPGFTTPVGIGTTAGRTHGADRRRPIAAIIGIALAVGALGGVVISNALRSLGPSGVAAPGIRVPISLEGHYGGDFNPAELTPDCTALLDLQGGFLRARPLNEEGPRRQFALPGARLIVSPDGQQVASFAGGDIWSGRLSTGQVVRVAEDVGQSPSWHGASWGSDGFIYFTPDATGGIHRVSASGGEPEQVTTLDPDRGELNHRFPHLLPNGRGLLYTSWTGQVDSASVVLRDLERGTTQIVHRGMSARYSRSGHIVFGRSDGSLQAMPFDLEALEAAGATVTVESGVTVTPMGEARFSLCEKGVLTYQTSMGTLELFMADREGRERSIDVGLHFTAFSFSPDGTHLAAARRDERGDNDIWVYDLAGGGERRVSTEGTNWTPTWSPDGERVAFYSDRTGSYSLHAKRSDGSGPAQLLLDSGDHETLPDWAPNGRWMVYTSRPAGGGSGGGLWILPLDGGAPQPLVQSSASAIWGKFSPDSRYVA